MSSTKGWVARGAGRAASSNSVIARSDKVVTITGSWLGPFVVFLLGEVKKRGSCGRTWGSGWLQGEVALMALPLLHRPSWARLGLGAVECSR